MASFSSATCCSASLSCAGCRGRFGGRLCSHSSRRRGEAEVVVMPTAGGTPRQVTFFGHAGTVVLGFAPDGRLLIASAGSAPFRSHSWSYAIDLSEGADPTPQQLPFGPVNGVAI